MSENKFTFEFVHFSPAVEEHEHSSSLPAKRKLGRPVGSKNMKKRCIEDEQDDTKKRGPGRPRGSGPKQRAQAKATALSQSRNIAWIPGVPLKIPGTIRNQVSSQDTDNTVSISDSLTSDQFITSSDEVPPLNDGRSAINRVRDHVDADAELQTIPLHNLPADLPNDSIHTITDDVEDSGNLRSFASEGLGPDEIEELATTTSIMVPENIPEYYRRAN
ncbi:hypothetical protein C0989_011864 [Termitomyces sp. Mn162]|nr:hypothetical protein C0989_011864 [Termitomyces sp. Mn162]